MALSTLLLSVCIFTAVYTCTCDCDDSVTVSVTLSWWSEVTGTPFASPKSSEVKWPTIRIKNTDHLNNIRILGTQNSASRTPIFGLEARPKRIKSYFQFPDWPFEIGIDCKFFIAIFRKGKEKPTFQWKFHESRMKNNVRISFYCHIPKARRKTDISVKILRKSDEK